jgi:5'-nucleotidase
MKPLILVTNDDGILSPGLHALAEVAASLGDVLIAAPAEQQTSMGRAKPRPPNGGVIKTMEIPLDGIARMAYAVNASPALCVAHAVLELAPRKPDLCLSGINYGENIGYSFTASGTIGACVEAQAFGVPGLAVSLETPLHLNHTRDYEPLDWRVTKHFARVLAERILKRGLPSGVGLLNLNVPTDATEATELRWTRQSAQNYYVWATADSARDRELPYKLSSDKRFDHATIEPDSDVKALIADRVVSVTPIARNATAAVSMRDW